MEQNGVLQYLPNNPSFASHAIHTGNEPERWTNKDIVPPICLSTIYKQELPPDHKGLEYTRIKNPTRDCLENCLAKLEGMKHCLVFSSGSAAAHLVTKMVNKGDHILVQSDLYHGIYNIFKLLKEETDEIEVTFVDASDPASVENGLQSNTKLVWLETPTNPLMKLIDLKALSTIIKQNAPSALSVCDNTFMSPYFQRPSTLGIDIVLHSCTKYIGGHSDTLMGALCLNDTSLYQRLLKKQILLGPTPSSFDCYLVLRSLKTLELRMQKHMSNALAIAHFLENHPKIEKVFHPGLLSHPQHELSLNQCYGHSGIFSFYVKGHELKTTREILKRFKLIQVAESLGGTETTMKLPSRMPYGALTEKEMEEQGITDGLLRISTGLENVQDLIDDLDQALSF